MVNVPLLAGMKMMGRLSSYPAFTGRPRVTLYTAWNGALSAEDWSMVAGSLPALLTVMVTFACLPTGTGPNFTDAGEARNKLFGVRPWADRSTRALPPELVHVRVPSKVPVLTGAKTICATNDWPCATTVPILGTP